MSWLRADTTPKLILCVDDEPAILDAIKRSFRRQALRVITAQDGEDALLKAAQYKPDLILLDIQMPGMDGYETLRMLRAAKFDKTPVILLTGEGNPNKGYKEGCLFYAEKPCSPEKLLHIMEYLLGNPTDERRAWLEERITG